MQKVWHQGGWYSNPAWGDWRYVRPGERDPAVSISDDDIEYRIDGQVVQQLILALDKAGWIVPRLDERLRAEDLKMTHRLLDLLEQKGAQHEVDKSPRD